LDALAKEGYSDTFYHQETSSSSSKEDNVVMLPLATSWTNNPLMRIDHIYAKQVERCAARGTTAITTLVPKRHYRLDTDASDHFPVVLEAVL